MFNKGSLSFLSMNAGYGIGLMIGVYMAAGVTGGHLNPAITLAMALRGKTSWLKVRKRTLLVNAVCLHFSLFADSIKVFRLMLTIQCNWATNDQLGDMQVI